MSWQERQWGYQEWQAPPRTSGLAIAGIVVGLLGTAFFVLAFVVFGIGTFWASSR